MSPNDQSTAGTTSRAGAIPATCPFSRFRKLPPVADAGTIRRAIRRARRGYSTRDGLAFLAWLSRIPSHEGQTPNRVFWNRAPVAGTFPHADSSLCDTEGNALF